MTTSMDYVRVLTIMLFCYLYSVEVVVGGSRPARSLMTEPYEAQMNVKEQNSLSWQYSVRYNSTNQDTNPKPDDRGQTPAPGPTPGPGSGQDTIVGSSKTKSKSKSSGKKRKKRGAMIREFLYEHNKIRQELNEPALAWDKKLARYAERYANERKKTCDLVHSEGEYGESIYWGMHYDRHSAAEAVRAWASEGKYYDLNTHTCDDDQKCGHFTQMIWRSSKRIGCARVKCDSGGVFIICVYDPPGNYRNEDPLLA